MSERQEKVSTLLQHLVAAYVQQEANTDPLITITHANISPELRNATIFFTTLPNGREDDALIFLKRNATDLRTYLKKHAQLKTIPHLDFMVDAGERHRQHMDELVRETGTESTFEDLDKK